MIPDTLLNALSEARQEKAIRAEIGLLSQVWVSCFVGESQVLDRDR